jgi:hypothetical protein
MEQQQQERVERLRAVLRKMERSIDDARTRRESTSLSESNSAPMGNLRANSGQNPGLDTPIISNGPAPPARTEATMFNFDKPRLKARPKRRPAI